MQEKSKLEMNFMALKTFLYFLVFFLNSSNLKYYSNVLIHQNHVQECSSLNRFSCTKQK